MSAVMCCRCSSLMLSVNHLAMLAKTSCALSGVLDWVDQSLADVEEHLKVCALFVHLLSYIHDIMYNTTPSVAMWVQL